MDLQGLILFFELAIIGLCCAILYKISNQRCCEDEKTLRHLRHQLDKKGNELQDTIDKQTKNKTT